MLLFLENISVCLILSGNRCPLVTVEPLLRLDDFSFGCRKFHAEVQINFSYILLLLALLGIHSFPIPIHEIRGCFAG